MKRTALSTAVLIVALSIASIAGDPVQDLTRLVQDAAGSANPTMAFLRGAATLPDFTLERSDVQRALELAGVPGDGPLRQLLGPTTRLVKKGDKIAIQRSEATKLAMGTGAIEVGRDVQVRLKLNGNEATIDQVKGLDVGKTADDLYTLQSVKFMEDQGKPVAKVTAGPGWPLTQTVLVDLSPDAPGAVSAPQQGTQATNGITQAMKR